MKLAILPFQTFHPQHSLLLFLPFLILLQLISSVKSVDMPPMPFVKPVHDAFRKAPRVKPLLNDTAFRRDLPVKPLLKSEYGKDPPVTPLLNSAFKRDPPTKPLLSLARSAAELTCDHRLYQVMWTGCHKKSPLLFAADLKILIWAILGIQFGPFKLKGSFFY